MSTEDFTFPWLFFYKNYFFNTVFVGIIKITLEEQCRIAVQGNDFGISALTVPLMPCVRFGFMCVITNFAPYVK